MCGGIDDVFHRDRHTRQRRLDIGAIDGAASGR